jgi:hypothetical protein
MPGSPFGPVPANSYRPWKNPFRWRECQRALRFWTKPVQDRLDYLTRKALYDLATMSPEEQQRLAETMQRVVRASGIGANEAVDVMSRVVSVTGRPWRRCL